MIDVARIELARSEIDPVFLGARRWSSDRLGLGDATAVLQDETDNPIGSFKGRGAYWWLLCQGRPRRVVCASAGNFGQGLAYAGRALGTEVEVWAAENANAAKLAAMRELGADVRLHGRDFDDAKARAAESAKEARLLYVEDGLADEIAEGAGTIGLELLEEPRPLAAIYLPVGNGALANGVGAVVRSRSPATRIVGVCARGAPSMARSFRERAAIATDAVDTIADGIAARVPIPRALEHLYDIVDDMLLVDDGEIVAAMKSLWRHEGVVTEPAGAVSLAGARADPERPSSGALGIVVTGRNLDPARAEEWLGEPG